MRLIKLFTICTALIFTTTVSAQKNFFKEAERYFNSGMVQRAIDSYLQAYPKAAKLPSDPKAKKIGSKGYIKYKLGDCYYRFREVDKAKEAYNTAIDLKYYNDQPDVYLKLGNVLKEMSDYDGAKSNYDKYYELTKDVRGKEGAESCVASMEMMKNKTRYKVTEENILNTDEYDFSPLYISKKYDEIYFTSNRKGATGEVENDRTGGQNKDVWHCIRDKKGNWSQPVILGSQINSEHDEGAACVDKKGKAIYFTRCIHDKKKSLGCDIYTSIKKGSKWETAEKLPLRPEGWEDSAMAIGHPCLSPDDQYLLFASDMEGGQGGLDIWMSEYDKREKKWKKPVNLGPTINTPGNEMFPHIRPNGHLYISSDGHGGLGGLDIFKCKKAGKMQWEKPANMGVPINSNADDYGIVFEGNKERGLFTSNRKGKTKLCNSVK